MMTGQMMMEQRPYVDVANQFSQGWLGGAAAGLISIRGSVVSPRWMDFIVRVTSALKRSGRVFPVWPGETVSPPRGQPISMFDALAGYVSLTGRVRDGCLVFPVPAPRVSAVLNMLGTGTAMGTGARTLVVVDTECLSQVVALLPVAGPVRDDLEEAMS